MKIIRQHLRLGFTGALLYLDAVPIIMFLVDVVHYHNTGLSIIAAFRAPLSSEEVKGVLRFTVLWWFLYLLGLPMLLLVARIALFRSSLKGHLVATGRRVYGLHAAFLLAVPLFLVFLYSLRILSGWTLSVSASAPLWGYQFEPLSLRISSIGFAFAVWLLKLYGSPTLWIGTVIAGIALALHYKDFPQWFKDYLITCELADINPQYQPIDPFHSRVFQSVKVWPETRGIAEAASTACACFMRLVPGSKAAEEFRSRLSAETIELIRKVLLPTENQPNLDVLLFSDPQRALIALLATIPSPKMICLSPFESKEIGGGLKWYSQETGCEITAIDLPSQLWDKSWKMQEDQIVEQFEMIRSKFPDRKIIFLVSEVNPYTGMVVPLDSLIGRLRKGKEVCVIVDASNSVGNAATVRFIRTGDFYFFGSQKWLMGPNGCGVVVAPSPSSVSHDLVLGLYPEATGLSAVRAISELRASLSAAASGGPDFKDMWHRSGMLQNRFLENVRARFSVYGEVLMESGNRLERTFITAIRPKNTFVWKRDASENISEVSSGIELPKSGSTRDPIVLSFPYFLDFWQLNRLCRVLNGSVEVYGEEGQPEQEFAQPAKETSAGGVQ